MGVHRAVAGVEVGAVVAKYSGADAADGAGATQEDQALLPLSTCYQTIGRVRLPLLLEYTVLLPLLFLNTVLYIIEMYGYS